jgi:hypothetical protein
MPAVTDKTVPELTTFRWSSSTETDRFPVEAPATGQVIAVIQGAGPDQVDTAVEAAHRLEDIGQRPAEAMDAAGIDVSIFPVGTYSCRTGHGVGLAAGQLSRAATEDLMISRRW